DEVDRYQWYIYREVRNRCEYEDSNVFYLVLSRILERIADHAVNACNLIKGRNNFLKRETIISGLSLSLSVYNESMDAFYSRNFKVLNDIINRKTEVSKMKYHMIEDLIDNPALTSISEEISRIGLYATDIAELTMDLIVSEQIEINV
ncbi:MAG: PhoU domain-containing protein, partial [Thermoplasmata archaeon]